jgi:hypothetical protein
MSFMKAVRSLPSIGALLLMALLTACDDDKNTPGLNDFVAMEKNDQKWLGVTEIDLNKQNDTLVFLGIGNRPNDEVIVLKVKFAGAGTYALQHGQAQYYTTIGGDVLSSEYKLDPNTIGTLQIVAYDSVKKTLEGKFWLELKKHRSNPETNIERMKINNGLFRGKLN